jgi:hypothetical protein
MKTLIFPITQELPTTAYKPYADPLRRDLAYGNANSHLNGLLIEV